ncbi:MAG TPA: glycosyltransferase family 9 protein, partial [Phycisphaerales bacterium]|nr:glycosyltransferase family 9 protein [Phycisphaerales bacterium]
MATPALALLRRHLRASFIGALVRPGLDELLAGSALADGSPLVDEFHVERSKGVMGPKVVASRIRPRRYDAALLLTNSFSTALITRLAFIPRRVGYDRDGRGLLLTHRLTPRLRNSTEVAVKQRLWRELDFR